MPSVYICKKCNMLLIRMEERVISHNMQKLDLGGYETLFKDCYPSHAMSRCPTCYGIGKLRIAVEEESTLRELNLEVDVVREILRIWRRLPDDAKDDIHGIPLDNQELRELLLEELI